MQQWIHRSKAKIGGQNVDIGRYVGTLAVVDQSSSWRE